MGKSSNVNPLGNFGGCIKVSFYALLLAGVYFSTLSWLITHDWAKDDFTYCYLIPLIALYLIWEKRVKLSRLASIQSWKAMVGLCGGIILFWLGELSGEFFTLYISFWLAIVSLCWIHLGWEKIKTICFPLIFLLAMFPLPNFLYNKVSVSLKLISSQLGVAMMQIYGMSAHREGNIIDLGFTQLQVVDACSGLRYLIPLIVLGLLLAYFYRASFWKKAIVVISTVPLSIITNSLRIAMTGILYEVWGAKVAESFFHGFSGWFIFMFSLAVLLLEMWVLKKVFPERKRAKGIGQRAKDTEAQREGRSQDDSPPTSDLQPPTQKGLAAFSQPQFLVAVILLSATLALSQGIEFREKIPIQKSFERFPLTVGRWSGRQQSMEQKFVDTLDLSDYAIIDYQDGQGRGVNFYVAYYESQRKGESIHSPATCLPGSGWIFSEAGEATIPVPSNEGRAMRVNRAFMQKAGYKQLSYYWFPQRGRILTNAYQLKIFAFWDALTKQRTDGALVRVITPVYEFEELKDAEARLQAFTREIVPVLDDYIPGGDTGPRRKNIYRSPVPDES